MLHACASVPALMKHRIALSSRAARWGRGRALSARRAAQSVLYAGPGRAVPGHGHRVLLVAGRRAPGAPRPAGRRGARGARGRRQRAAVAAHDRRHLPAAGAGAAATARGWQPMLPFVTSVAARCAAQASVYVTSTRLAATRERPRIYAKRCARACPAGAMHYTDVAAMRDRRAAAPPASAGDRARALQSQHIV